MRAIIFAISLLAGALNVASAAPETLDPRLLESFSDSSAPSASAMSSSTEQILHLQNITPESILQSPIYIGQKIPITYRVLFFDNASLNQSSFKEKTTTSTITLENPNQPWQESATGESTPNAQGQKAYEITYIFKIKAPSARIPAFEVSAISADGAYIDVATTEPLTLSATDLYQNKNYVGVVGQDLQLGIYKAKPYDEHNNLIAFELIAKQANLEDFKLPNVEKQGIERSSFDLAESRAIFYAILPRSVQNLLLEYFSTQTNRFEQIRIPVIPVVEGVTTQENLKPKNTYLIYWALVLAGVAISFFVLAFFSKRLRKVLIALGIGVLLYLLYQLLYTKTAMIDAQTKIWILPTHNSTLLESTSAAMQVKIIGEHDKYYKISTPTETIGWIRKDDAK